MGDWLFGCDVCQDVCPWNRKSPAGAMSELEPLANCIDPVEILAMDDAEFRRRFRHTALWRTRRAGLARNAAIVLGNVGDANALPALRRAVDDPDAAVREAAQWAIEQIRARM